MGHELGFFIMMLTVFISYVGFIWAKYGVQHSISQSYYVLPDNLKRLMTVFCWGFAIPAMIIGSTALMFIAGSGIAFVGAAAAFQQKLTKWFHFAGAGIGVAAGEFAMIFNFGLWPVFAAFLAIGLPLFIFRKKIPNWIWWLEITAFVTICIGLGIAVVF